MYPYDFWATYLQSARFSDGWQERFHINYADLVIPGTGERLTEARLRRVARWRTSNKLVAAYAIPEQDVVTGLQSPMTMIGSDAILTPGNNNHPRRHGLLHPGARSLRPRAAGALARRRARQDDDPAGERLEAKAPALQKKGRLQRGADADITIFDPTDGGRPGHRRRPVPTVGRQSTTCSCSERWS